jgi:CubicO group peptidase (beta-lactamase class C family)
MEKWLSAALDYIPRWIEHQMRLTELPGCVLAVAHRGKLVSEQAFGLADLDKGTRLSPRHRFRIASHSKTFTAAGVMKLRAQGRLGLDDPVGRYVEGLHPAVAQVTIAQCLVHSAGIIRDGRDSDHWVDRHPFLDAPALRAALAEAPIIAANTRFKYSNHGFALVGLVIEAVTGDPYTRWIKREIVDPAGLEETEPDAEFVDPLRMASGHSAKLPLGRRVVIGGHNPTRALAPAAGFVSTAADLVRFFGGLDPDARVSPLDVASRREMVRPQWRSPHSSVDVRYGQGLMLGSAAGWKWFGHGGAFQGFISRTMALPEPGLTLSLVTNAIDGPASTWIEGLARVLRRYAEEGPPARRIADWTGRWWSTWRALDLVPVGDRVLVAHPELANPFEDAAEITVSGRDRGVLALANGFESHGEEVHRRRDAGGRVVAIRFGGGEYRPEAKLAAEMKKRYRIRK